jgi:hypothetical protein
MARVISIEVNHEDAVNAVFALREMCEAERQTAATERQKGNGDLANHIEHNISRVQVLINAISQSAFAQ